MNTFAPAVTRQWFGDRPDQETIASSPDGAFVVVSDADPEFPLTLLRARDHVRVRASAALASELGLASSRTDADVMAAVDRAGLALHGADHLFYFDSDGRAALEAEADADGVRILRAEDAAVFSAFTAQCSPQDLDDAYVELDHPTVVGAFVGDRLVCAASTYAWGDDEEFADTGVLTDPAFRGRGFGRAVVRAISRRAIADGLEPQYRCQLDNEASVALARSAGLSSFGTWDAVTSDDEE